MSGRENKGGEARDEGTDLDFWEHIPSAILLRIAGKD